MVEHEFFVTHTIFPTATPESGNSVVYLRALLENSPIAIVVLDAQHRYTMCNPAFERLFQYTPKQLASDDLDALIAYPEQAEQVAQLTRLVLQGVKVHTVGQRRRRDGMMLDVEIHGIPLIVDGELAGVYALYQDVTQQNRARQAFRNISDRLEHLQQEERRRLARDLHDSTSQELAVLNWNLARLSSAVPSESVELNRLVRETREIARQCSERIRSASYLLHPPALGEGGLTRAVPWMVEGFEQRSCIRVHLEMPEDLGRFRDDIEITLYRVLQEGLANVLRHSGSPEVTVCMHRKDNWLELAIQDQGTNASREMRPERGGVGINSMRERLEQLGGFLAIDWGRKGTTLTATVPIEG